MWSEKDVFVGARSFVFTYLRCVLWFLSPHRHWIVEWVTIKSYRKYEFCRKQYFEFSFPSYHWIQNLLLIHAREWIQNRIHICTSLHSGAIFLCRYVLDASVDFNSCVTFCECAVHALKKDVENVRVFQWKLRDTRERYDYVHKHVY